MVSPNSAVLHLSSQEPTPDRFPARSHGLRANSPTNSRDKVPVTGPFRMPSTLQSSRSPTRIRLPNNNATVTVTQRSESLQVRRARSRRCFWRPCKAMGRRRERKQRIRSSLQNTDNVRCICRTDLTIVHNRIGFGFPGACSLSLYGVACLASS